jgi:copper transport protein
MADPLFAWSEVASEYATFLSSYALLGAAGFWLVIARPSLAGADADAPMARAARTAAGIGLGGAVLGLLLAVLATAERAAEKGLEFWAALADGGPIQVVRVVLLVALVLLFVPLAGGRTRSAWPVAVVAVIALALRAVVRLRWQALVNPLHVLGGGLWLGTLAVLALTVIPMALRGELAPRGRGPTLSELVARFSRLSLGSAALLGTSGIVTAWRHLKYPSALWTTSYGVTFLAKLAMVGVVVALGAYNWRRVSPRLESEDGAAALRRSTRAELVFAGLVLAVSAILVSLPAPEAPRPAGTAPAAAAAPGGGSSATAPAISAVPQGTR